MGLREKGSSFFKASVDEIFESFNCFLATLEIVVEVTICREVDQGRAVGDILFAHGEAFVAVALHLRVMESILVVHVELVPGGHEHLAVWAAGAVEEHKLICAALQSLVEVLLESFLVKRGWLFSSGRSSLRLQADRFYVGRG